MTVMHECDECDRQWLTLEEADYCAAEDMSELDEQEDPGVSTFEQEFQRRLRKLLGVADEAYVFVELRGGEMCGFDTCQGPNHIEISAKGVQDLTYTELWELVEDLEAVDEQEDPA